MKERLYKIMHYTYEDKNSVSYYLAQKSKQIYGMTHNDDCSLEAMKKNIISYIWNATYKYTAYDGSVKFTSKKGFVDGLNNCATKSELKTWCDAWVRGGKTTESSYANKK